MTQSRNGIEKVPLKEGQDAFFRVFASRSPVDMPFRDHITHRAVLYPQEYIFAQQELAALLIAAHSVGDQGFVVFLLEVPDGDEEYWYIPQSHAHSYGDLVFAQNAVFSPNGLWGAYVSDARIGVVGGTEVFFANLVTAYPGSFEKHRNDFLEVARDWIGEGIEPPWLKDLIAHLWGREFLNAWMGAES